MVVFAIYKNNKKIEIKTTCVLVAPTLPYYNNDFLY